MAPASNPDPQTSLHLPSDPAIPLSDKPVGFSSTQASVLLDIVRGLAAVAVLLGHWRNLFFVDYPSLPAHRLLFAIPYVLTSAGHQAVIIFFVLSGYLISGSVFRMFERGQWSWRSYLLHRVVRLWIVLLPGLLLAAFWDVLGTHLHSAGVVAMYHGASGNAETGDIASTLHLSTWLGNLFFLQGIFVPVFGSDSPLWSLANEFWYYLLFPLGLIALRRETALWGRMLCVLGCAAIAWALPAPVLILFPAWLLGTLMAVLRPPKLAAGWRIAATIGYLPIVFVLPKVNTSHRLLEDLLFGLITFAFLYVLLSARERSREDSRMTHLWRTLARFSYTLYVVHLPLLVLIAALTLGVTRWVPTVAHVGMAAVLLVLAMLYSYGLAALTEFRTDRLRKAIERRLPR
jgi:peptidoglycan/LPS O-acetylase OafA/YrhL